MTHDQAATCGTAQETAGGAVAKSWNSLSFSCEVVDSHRVLEAVVVADVDPHTGQPVLTTVLPVGDGDGGDGVGFQQVHGPPGLPLLGGVGTRPVVKVVVTVSIDGAVGVPERVFVTGGLAGFSTQGHVFCRSDGTKTGPQ